MKDADTTDEERAYAPPARFDTAIGYWTGEPDETAVERAIVALTWEAHGVIAGRCERGHLHLRGPRTALAVAEAALAAIAPFRRLERCDLE